MTELELLALIKKEGKCKNNLELANLMERLYDLAKGKTRKAAYLTDSKIYKLAQIDTPPEFDYIK